MSRDQVLIRSSPVIRALGWWMCCIALLGVGVATIDTGVIAFVLVGALWAAPAFWWGWRTSHVGVVAAPDDLVIHNPLRTHRVRYEDITDVCMRSRYEDHPRPRLRSVINRRVGIVVVKDRPKPIEMQATDWLWSTRSLLGASRRRSDGAVDAVKAAWLERSSSHR